MTGARTPCGMIALQPSTPKRHPFRLRLLGTLPRELREPALRRQALLFVPAGLATVAVVLIASAVLP